MAYYWGKGDNISEKTTNNISVVDYFAGLKSRRTKLDDINMMINWKPVEARLKNFSSVRKTLLASLHILV